jgi:hypothetical protein
MKKRLVLRFVNKSYVIINNNEAYLQLKYAHIRNGTVGFVEIYDEDSKEPSVWNLAHIVAATVTVEEVT